MLMTAFREAFRDALGQGVIISIITRGRDPQAPQITSKKSGISLIIRNIFTWFLKYIPKFIVMNPVL